jgi:hypothetical protein
VRSKDIKAAGIHRHGGDEEDIKNADTDEVADRGDK